VVPIRLSPAIAIPLAAALAIGVAGYAATLLLPATLVNLVMIACAMAVAYGALLLGLDRRRLRNEIGRLLTQFQPVAPK
jgi:hypothetical protein